MPPEALIGSAYRRRPVALVSAGVDWLTVTHPPGDRAVHLVERANRLARAEQARGCDLRPTRALGYTGWQAGEVGAGWRDDGVIVRLSGTLAREHWQAFYTLGGRPSRLDAQVTIAGWPAGDDLADRGWQQFVAHRPKTGRPPGGSRLTTVTTGATLTLGARSSAWYARLYDKGAEQGGEHLSGNWRYEVEWKSDAAAAAAQALDRHPYGVAGLCGVVHAFFSERGVRPVWTPREAPVPITASRALSDDDRRLRWLARHVRPTIDRLVLAGRSAEVARALGLNAEPTRPAVCGGSAGGIQSSC